jgi:hypothetical protein
MRVVQRRERREAVVSLVLLDWSVRETFQLLHYLAQQTAPRECFEVIVVEYYGREAPALAPWASFIDTWLLLEMPARCYYHKHLMYNAGLVLAQGEVVLFCDSDAMVRETFLGSVIAAFRAEPRQVLHLDQFRNARRDLYPFAFPSFDDVLGPGCINNVDGRPRGLVVAEDTLHERNYGACMAAPRRDLLAIGGADEHHDYLGHICGPYELTFRLAQAGVPERWHPTEFLYHTWHPGQAGAGNYLGPHDGRHMSTTALEVLTSGRTRPLVANPAVARLHAAPGLPLADRLALLIDRVRAERWTVDRTATHQADNASFEYLGYRVERSEGGFVGRLIVDHAHSSSVAIVSDTPAGARQQIERALCLKVRLMIFGSWLCVLISQARRVRWAGVRRWLSSFGRAGGTGTVEGSQLGGRVRRLFEESGHVVDSLRCLLVNLQALGSTKGENQPVVVFIDGRAAALYTSLLSAFGLLPRLEVMSPKTPSDVRARLAELDRSGRRHSVIVMRDMFFRYHPAFATVAHAVRVL